MDESSFVRLYEFLFQERTSRLILTDHILCITDLPGISKVMAQVFKGLRYELVEITDFVKKNNQFIADKLFFRKTVIWLVSRDDLTFLPQIKEAIKIKKSAFQKAGLWEDRKIFLTEIRMKNP
jgi:hypothetical protein